MSSYINFKGGAKALVTGLVLALVISAGYFSCINPPNFPETPVITFKSVNQTVINEEEDSVRLVFSFTDGNGDLGLTQEDTSSNTFVTDVRTGKLPYTYFYRIPYVTEGGMIDDISGDITIVLPGVACIPDRHNDTVVFSIQIKDRAGNLSNKIETPKISINCNF